MNFKKEYSYTRPILFQGKTFPSAEQTLIGNDGNLYNKTVFADKDGNSYFIDSKNALIPVTPYGGELPNVLITTPKRKTGIVDMANDYLTMSNDNTKVTNQPHREYNPHLKSQTLQGAKSNAIWEKEHPNASSWMYALNAAPFAIAAAPAVIPAGQTLVNTALGQAAINGVSKVMTNPIVNIANTGLGLWFAGKGANDVIHGKFTPETAIDLIGFPIGVNAEAKVINGLKRNNFSISKYVSKESGIPINIKKEGSKRYIDFIESSEYQNRLQNAGLENRWDNIKNLTNKRLNGFGYFPGRNQEIVYNDPHILGLSSMSNPWKGITLKNNLYPNRVMPTLDHEIAHWATKNADVTDKGFLGDMMAYNESVIPNIPWEDILKKKIELNPRLTIDEASELEKRYNYLIDPQEKRARAFSLYQQAKDNKMSTDDFIDMWTAPNGNVYSFAPEQLKDMSEILTIDNMKKYLNKFLGITAPIGVGTATMYNKK